MDDSRDDGIPIRRHTKRRGDKPAWVRPFLLAVGCGMFGGLMIAMLVLAVRSSGRGHFVAPRQTNNARCPSCGKEWCISEDSHGPNSAMVRNEYCPSCHLACKPIVLYMIYSQAHPTKGQKK